MTDIKVLSAQVVTSRRGPDVIMLTVDLPNPAFPFDGKASLRLTAAADSGAAYVRKNFKIEPEVIR